MKTKIRVEVRKQKGRWVVTVVGDTHPLFNGTVQNLVLVGGLH